LAKVNPGRYGHGTAHLPTTADDEPADQTAAKAKQAEASEPAVIS
jgi:hypothetical protein